MNDFQERLLAATPPPCPRCSTPAPGTRCPRCNADTSAAYVRMPKGTPNVR